MPGPTHLLRAHAIACIALLGAAWPLSLVHPELGAFRTWQIALNALLFVGVALHLRRGPPSGLFAFDTDVHVPASLRRALFAAALLWTCARTLSQYWAFDVNGADFSIFERMLWNTLHGRFAYSPIYGVNHFAVHQHYVLFALLPIYAVVSSPYVLLLAGAVAMWSALFPLWRLGRTYLRNEWFVLLLALAYLGSPWFAAMLDGGHRPEMLYPVAALTFLLGWVRQRPWVWGAGLALFLSCREDVALYTAAFGAAALIRERRPAAAVVVAASVALFALNLWWVRPAMSSGTASPQYMTFWSHYGSSTGEVVLAMLTQPVRVLTDVLTSRWYLLLGPALLLPLLSPRAALALLPGLILFGTSNTPLRLYRGYGPSILLPFVLFGMVEAARFLRSRAAGQTPNVVVLLALLLFPLIGAAQVRLPRPRLDALRALPALHTALAERPADCVQFALYPYLPQSLEPQAADVCWRDPHATVLWLPGESPWPLSRHDADRLERHLRANGKPLAGGFLIGPGLPNPAVEPAS